MPKILPYFPAKDCRHRVAAIALYRALIQTAQSIELPQKGTPNNDAHPIVDLVRRRFKGNKDDASLRLVYSSMTAGYKFLHMLHKAREARSPEQQQLIEFLRKREKVYQSQQAKRAAKETPQEPLAKDAEAPRNEKEKPDKEFLIRNIAGPFEPARYEGKARPRSALTRRRKVPIFATEAYGFPFLRYGPSQPEALSKMVRSQLLQWRNSVNKLIALGEEEGPTAKWEDVWEENLERAWREEQDLEPLEEYEMDQDPQSSYVWAVQVGRLWYETKIELLWQDWVARGEALAKIVEEEKRLQEEEDKMDAREELAEPQNIHPGMMPAAPEGMDPALFKDVMNKLGPEDREDPTTAPEPSAKPIAHPTPASRDIIREMPHAQAQPAFSRWLKAIDTYKQKYRSDPPEVDPKDPYAHPIWGMSVDGADKRLRKFIATMPDAGRNARFYRKRGRGDVDDGNDSIAEFAVARTLKGGM